jgi:hypothetical protein
MHSRLGVQEIRFKVLTVHRKEAEREACTTRHRQSGGGRVFAVYRASQDGAGARASPSAPWRLSHRRGRWAADGQPQRRSRGRGQPTGERGGDGNGYGAEVACRLVEAATDRVGCCTVLLGPFLQSNG